MTDLVGGHSIALYYYNLAYSLPLYIHIDLRKDNEQALMFWWNASTCRYLGIGGTHQSPAVRQKHHDSMAVYRRLKPFFARGTFYGGDELTHIHVHPSEHAAVVNCFNLDPGEVTRSIAFHPARFKLPNRTDYRVVGAEARQEAGDYQISVTIPGYGHTLFEIRPAGQRTGRG